MEWQFEVVDHHMTFRYITSDIDSFRLGATLQLDR